MAKYRSQNAKALGLRQGQIIEVRETDMGLEVTGVNASARQAVIDGVQYDWQGRLRLRSGSLLARAGVQLRTRRGK